MGRGAHVNRYSNTALDVNLIDSQVPLSISNLPSGGESAPASADIVGAQKTSTGTLYTVPAGRVFRGSLEVSCSISVAGNAQPVISVSGTGVTPTGNLLQCEAVGLALTTVANSSTISNVYIHGGTSGATVTFTAAASGSSSGSITGRLL
jgi:hypothetical protein